MKKIFQVGAGLVGKTMALDLSKNHELHLCDTNLNLLEKVKSENNSIHIYQIDVQNNEVFTSWITDADIVLLAVPGFLGYEALKLIIECGKNVVDISFSPEDVLTLNELAVKNNVCAVVDAGVAPGIPNFLLGYWNSKMLINEFEYFVGGLPKNPKPPYNYKAPFSPIDVIEEYTRPARMMINSKIETKPALSDIEKINIMDVGELEAFNTDGLRSLLITMNHIPNMKEKTLRYPGHASLMQSIIKKDDFKDRIKNLLLDWKLEEDEPEFTVLDVNIYGNEKNIHYHMYDEIDFLSNSSSMARTTGFTATATVNMLLRNLWIKNGVSAPEIVGSNKECYYFLINYLKERNVNIFLNIENN